eukprot:SAG11_NODE_2886_length_2867_cov_1.874277_3_plen_126_part_00
MLSAGPFGWGTGGSSNNPCTDTYMGSEPRSEIEVGNVIDYIAQREQQLQAGVFLDLHSFGEFYITPWGTQVCLAHFDRSPPIAYPRSRAWSPPIASHVRHGALSPCADRTAGRLPCNGRRMRSDH